MRARSIAAIVLVLSPLAALAAQPTPRSLDDARLELVVALFRHGIRAPLQDFGENAKDHSGDFWPTLEQWGVSVTDRPAEWGDLTRHGYDVVTTLGRYYAESYRKSFGADFSVFLWADTDQRTRATASALAAGLTEGGLRHVKVEALPAGTKLDPLFHPFKAGCGTVNFEALSGIATEIRDNAGAWWTQPSNGPAASQMSTALACVGGCSPIESMDDVVCPCRDASSTCGPDRKICGAPISWRGPFAYGSSASEAFLLEYANGMSVGWGRVDPPRSTMPSKLRTMLQLHEFYFDQTQRRRTVAQIEGSNLLREIQAVLNRKTGSCQHAPLGTQFVGLVGHDTNIANVAALLDIRWSFDGTPLAGIPKNDPLPAGALVFELWRRPGASHLVRVRYIAQSLDQMRNDAAGAVPVEAKCLGRSYCIEPLSAFNRIVDSAKDRNFLSKCRRGKQECKTGTR